MKYCTHCGQEVVDEAVICVKCGCQTKQISSSATTKFCYHCGKELASEAVVCIHCGCSCIPVKTNENSFSSAISNLFGGSSASADLSGNQLVNTLSERMKIDAVIWIVIAIIQIIAGIFLDWFLLIVGVANIATAISDFKYSNDVLSNQNGIVAKFEPIVMPIIVCAYNLLIGGVIGIVGSIYYFIAIRGFVLNNKDAFLAIETIHE
ncbi:MAG: hypothetical protein IJC52_02265 [Clostridia bacterium]|nr:hypothetical protein [Clostridia bacterium]